MTTPTELLNTPAIPSLWTERQVAEALNCSVALIRKRRAHKQAPIPLKIGRLIRYRPETISAFLNQIASA
jgi:hypothetical protein